MNERFDGGWGGGVLSWCYTRVMRLRTGTVLGALAVTGWIVAVAVTNGSAWWIAVAVAAYFFLVAAGD